MKFDAETGGAESGARSGAKGGAAANGTTLQLAAKAAISRPEINEKGPLPFPAAGLLMTPTGIEHGRFQAENAERAERFVDAQGKAQGLASGHELATMLARIPQPWSRVVESLLSRFLDGPS